MSRLEGSAHRLARQLAIVRQEMDAANNVVTVTYRGIDAVSLLKFDAVFDPGTGAELIPAYDSGAKVLIDKLLSLNHLDDQDKAWVSLDQFFGFRRPAGMTFIEYLTEWDRLYEDAWAKKIDEILDNYDKSSWRLWRGLYDFNRESGSTSIAVSKMYRHEGVSLWQTFLYVLGSLLGLMPFVLF